MDLLENMAKAGPVGDNAARYLVEKKVYIDFKPIRGAGAMYLPWWWPGKGFPHPKVYLDANTYSLETSPSDPYMVSLVIHETVHLQQGVVKALSVQGELEAWQAQYQAHNRFVEEILPDEEKLGGKWDEIAALSLDSRADLERAQELMVNLSPGYQADLLPLYPLPQEIAYHVQHIMEAVLRLGGAP
ncbi:MAG: hypothetical protein D6770_02500 [Anaerolineae bacterium]|nr:MAG: hypothetical protein D6770_02500 [Anaerolineae bacterium]